MATTASMRRQASMRGKLIFFSVALFLFIFIFGGASFVLLMQRTLLDNAGEKLAHTVGYERLQLEASVNSEIAVVLKMANSPLIMQYFLNPDNLPIKEIALREIAAYRRIFTSNTVFWVSNKDKMFYSDDKDPFLLDTENPDNYWYNMTLNETKVYNFNINYNPDLNITNLWINAPVFDSEGKAIGILGTGIGLSSFITNTYRNYSESADLYFFNAGGEITGAKEINYVINKVNIGEKLGQAGARILATAAALDSGGITHFIADGENRVTVVGSIPALGWYVAAVQSFGMADALNNGMTVLFVVMIVALFIIIVLFNIFAAGLLDKSESAKAHAEAAKEVIVSGLAYAGTIQKHLLPPDSELSKAFSDYSIIWKPRDVVGGDIYWAKNFDDGMVLCVADCTGHGTPGALLTMLVVSAFESIIKEERRKDTAEILYRIDRRIATVLNVKKDGGINMNINDGCDLAVLFIANDGSVTISSGHINVFVCDGNTIIRYKGQGIYVGDGALTSKEKVQTVNIPASPNNKFYIASDGMFDQIGGDQKRQFGYKTFERIALENHNEKQSVISDRIWRAFEEYRGEEARRDDFELITFKPKMEVM